MSISFITIRFWTAKIFLDEPCSEEPCRICLAGVDHEIKIIDKWSKTPCIWRNTNLRCTYDDLYAPTVDTFSLSLSYLVSRPFVLLVFSFVEPRRRTVEQTRNSRTGRWERVPWSAECGPLIEIKALLMSSPRRCMYILTWS